MYRLYDFKNKILIDIDNQLYYRMGLEDIRIFYYLIKAGN